MNIYERMSAITNELDRVAKNKTVGNGVNSYKAVMENDVLLAVKPLEEKHGVYSYPVDREIVFEKDYQIEKAGYKKDDPPKISFKFFVRVKTTYRFVNIEEPSNFIDMVSFGDGVDPQDKAPGKAMTYADKYALMKAYKIVTGDDPDEKVSDMSYQKKYTAPVKSDEQLQKDKIRTQAMIDKKKLPAELKVECGNDQALWIKLMGETVKGLGYKNFNEIDFTEISKAVFKGKFLELLALHNDLIKAGI